MSAPIRVLIRADAGRVLGTGHMARTSAVAGVLADCGAVETLLVANRDAVALVPSFFPGGIDVLALDEIGDSPSVILSRLEAEDRLPDVVFLDHYGEVPQWETAARDKNVRLLVIDDFDAASVADLIVRPHGGPAGTGDAIFLRGPAYLPLSRHVVEAAARDRPATVPDRLRMNVCFGGTDPTGETAKVIEAVQGPCAVDADIVIGPGAQVDRRWLDVAEALPHVTVHHAPSQADLTQLMAEADLALGAGGVMLWERLCLGLPSLVIAVADNQRPQIDAMAARGAIRFLGNHSDISPTVIADAVGQMAADVAGRAAMRQLGHELVDGRGAQRIAAWLRALALEARDVTLADGPALLDWRTDDRNWEHNWDRAPKPELSDHMAWLAKRLDDPGCVFRIIMRHSQPIGVVRFDLSDDGRDAYLSIYLVPEWHGQRLGLPVLFAAERALRRSHPGVERIVSRIHQGNAASVRLHRDAGFRFAQSDERADWYDAVKPLD